MWLRLWLIQSHLFYYHKLKLLCIWSDISILQVIPHLQLLLWVSNESLNLFYITLNWMDATSIRCTAATDLIKPSATHLHPRRSQRYACPSLFLLSFLLHATLVCSFTLCRLSIWAFLLKHSLIIHPRLIAYSFRKHFAPWIIPSCELKGLLLPWSSHCPQCLDWTFILQRYSLIVC